LKFGLPVQIGNPGPQNKIDPYNGHFTPKIPKFAPQDSEIPAKTEIFNLFWTAEGVDLTVGLLVEHGNPDPRNKSDH